MFPRLHVTFLWLIYCVTGIFYLLLSFTYFSHVSSASPQQTSVCSLCLWLCFCFVMFFFSFLDSTCKWKSYGIWFSSLAYFLWNKILCVHSRSIYVVTNVKISFFFMAGNILYLLYPFIYQWTLRLLPYFGYCKYAAMDLRVPLYLFKLVFLYSMD